MRLTLLHFAAKPIRCYFPLSINPIFHIFYQLTHFVLLLSLLLFALYLFPTLSLHFYSFEILPLLGSEGWGSEGVISNLDCGVDSLLGHGPVGGPLAPRYGDEVTLRHVHHVVPN